MTLIPSALLTFIISPVMSSTNFVPATVHTVYGQVHDENGNFVDGADVVIESIVEKKEVSSSNDGSFRADICVCGPFDEIIVHASHGLKSGAEKVYPRGSLMAVDIVLRRYEG